MAIQQDPQTGDYIINGFERGIGDSMHSGATPLMGQYGIGGLGFMANTQIISVPGEVSVNFATSKISSPNVTGSVVSADAGTDTVVLNDNSLESGAWVTFAGGGIGNGLVAGTPYKLVLSTGNTYFVTTNFSGSVALNITGNSTGTYATINMGQPKYFAFDGSYYWMVDANGRVWSNAVTTTNLSAFWTYTGNLPNSLSTGNGLVYYAGYIFVFSGSSIDYTPVASASVAWVYQWNWLLGTIIAGGVFNNSPTTQFKLNGSTAIHTAMVAPDNKVYFTDGSWIGRWYQKDPAVDFVPTTLTTYIPDQTKVLPINDTAQCLAPLGNTLLVGGKNNVIYPWDTFSQTPQYPILLPEYNISQMVTVNTTTFIFVGNRGRIYSTNGSQATLYKKVPDFISNTIEPYFIWGGVCSNKNQLYFSFKATTNGGTALTTYGGVWAIDLDTKAIRLSNTLSYQTTVYNGYSSAIIPNFSLTAGGTGLFIGWDSGSFVYGIDTTTSAPYAGGNVIATTIIDSDLVPIGTVLKPTTNGRVEFKLTVPIVSGESVKLQYRQNFSGIINTNNFTDIDSNVLFNFSTITTTTASGNWNGYSGAYTNVNFQNSQWIQIRAILTSTASSPSFTRCFELRLGN